MDAPSYFTADTEPKGKGDGDCDRDIALPTDIEPVRFWGDRFVIFGAADRAVMAAEDLLIIQSDGDALHLPEDSIPPIDPTPSINVLVVVAIYYLTFI